MNSLLHLLIMAMVSTTATIRTSPTLLSGTVATEDSASVVRSDTVHTEAGSSFEIQYSTGVDERFKPLIERLVKDGWDREFVVKAFHDERAAFIPKMVRVNRPKQGSGGGAAAYAWVNTAESAEACRAFMEKYSEQLAAAQTKYGVTKETIAALLRCETRHGSVTGDYHVFSVYASMALMGEADHLQENLDRAREELKASGAKKAKVEDDLAYIRKRSNTRGDWAYRELKNLLTIVKENRLDGMALYGSWAGAFGWAQFLPSSYLRSAVDGNGDGKADLFDPADAIHSVANYLNKAGYKDGSSTKIKGAIRSYNPSTPYVESIYSLSLRLAKK